MNRGLTRINAGDLRRVVDVPCRMTDALQESGDRPAARILPLSPWRVADEAKLTTAVCAVALLAMGSSIVCAGIWRELRETRAYLEGQRIWDHGLVGERVTASTETVAGSLLVDHEIAVAYFDRDGEEHWGRVSFTALAEAFHPADRTLDAEVRYDPSETGRFALGASLRAGVGGIVGYLLAFLGAGGALIWFAFLSWRQLRALRACTSEGEEVRMEISGRGELYSGEPVTPPTGICRYAYRFVMGGRVFTCASWFNQTQPLFLGSSRHWCLGVVARSNPSLRVILRSDGYPFAFSGDELQGIQRKAVDA